MSETLNGITRIPAKVKVEFDYHGGFRGARNSMGVPEEPDDYPSVEILSVKDKDGSEWINYLTDEDIEKLEQDILNNISKE